MTRKWVLNASPLIALGKVSAIALLERICPDLIIPEGVVRELDQGPDDPARIWIHEQGLPFVRRVETVAAEQNSPAIVSSNTMIPAIGFLRIVSLHQMAGGLLGRILRRGRGER